ncbi:MAG: hypothetical protein ABS96_26390 [Lysobacteraceae bacterium SCN 69-123]|nr:MAG: hypothetical protein ABS96_26390 [Xanthomonadaceae bacterium SCN 69-123]
MFGNDHIDGRAQPPATESAARETPDRAGAPSKAGTAASVELRWARAHPMRRLSRVIEASIEVLGAEAWATHLVEAIGAAHALGLMPS